MNGEVQTAKGDFDKTFKDACKKPLNDTAQRMLDQIFQHTVEHALKDELDPQKWDRAAKKYVLPKLSKIAKRLDEAAADDVSCEELLQVADEIIRKFHLIGPVVWCKGYVEAMKDPMRALKCD